MSSLQTLLQKIIAFFHSGKAEAALTAAAGLVPMALPIVEEIAALAPNRTDVEIAAAFKKFAVPFSTQWLATPTAQRGYLLLQLATQVLSAKVPGVATSVLNAAVQLAFTGSHA